MVRETGLEPVRLRHTHLKRACLPIPALSHICFATLMIIAPLFHKVKPFFEVIPFSFEKPAVAFFNSGLQTILQTGAAQFFARKRGKISGWDVKHGFTSVLTFAVQTCRSARVRHQHAGGKFGVGIEL